MVLNNKKGPHRNAAPSLGIGLARLEFLKNRTIQISLANVTVVLEEVQQVSYVYKSIVVDITRA